MVGVLLGEYGDKDTLQVTNCYGIPFEEEKNEPEVWFLDHIYLENMFEMQNRINSREKIIGWYSSGPKIKQADIKINEIFRNYNTEPVLLVCNVQDEQLIGLPTEAYFTKEEVDENGNMGRAFTHVRSTIGATDAEAVAVEHLLRDVKDASQGQFSKTMTDKLLGIKVLAIKLKEMRNYLEQVIAGTIRYNQSIIDNFQDIFNLLPNLKIQEMVQSFSVKSNDYMYVVYVSNLIKSVLSLHDLINNKIKMKELEAENIKKEREDAAEKAKKVMEEEEAKTKKEVEAVEKKE